MPLIEIIVNTFLGSRYAEVNVIVYILTLGVLCMALARVLANELAGRGFPAVNAKIAGLSLAVNVAANLILIPQYGVNGAAAAASIAYVTLSTLTVQAYSRIVGVSVGQIISPRVADIHTALRFVRSMFSAVPK
jgi:O-antigen/teichoic acid export membrane protein